MKLNQNQERQCTSIHIKEKFEDIAGVIMSRRSKDRQYNDQKGTKGQTIVYKILHTNIEQHEPH